MHECRIVLSKTIMLIAKCTCKGQHLKNAIPSLRSIKHGSPTVKGSSLTRSSQPAE